MKRYWKRGELGYCSNVHPSENLDMLLEHFDQHLLPMQAERSLEQMMIGLWLNEPLIDELLGDSEGAERLVSLLRSNQLTIQTLNAFPQRGFHVNDQLKRIKQGVYLPDWSDQARLIYTCKILQFIERYPDIFTTDLSISTLPLGYGPDWNEQKHQQAIGFLRTFSVEASRLNETSGISVRLCLEMEPDCVLESSQQMVDFFINDLEIASSDLIQHHLGVCFDICHQAVMQENIGESLNQFCASGIVVGKIQVSSALNLDWNRLDQSHLKAANHPNQLLRPFVDSPYLHQLKIGTKEGLIAVSDFTPETWSDETLPKNSHWYIHFHLPIHKWVMEHDALLTTQKAIVDTVEYLRLGKMRPHLEVETYTWGFMLKAATATELNRNLMMEIQWLERLLQQYGMLEEVDHE